MICGVDNGQNVAREFRNLIISRDFIYGGHYTALLYVRGEDRDSKKNIYSTINC